MIFIYDFDGTLTPYSLPQYPILKKCGYNDFTLMNRVKSIMESGVGFYEAYYNCYMSILRENSIPMTRNNVCLGAKDTRFNEGVIGFLTRFGASKTGHKHYIVTSGVEEYVRETPVASLVDGIYGVTFSQVGENFGDINFLLSDKKKVDVIEKIRQANGGTKDIVYFGDGLTDGQAFRHVHNIGGRNVFIAVSDKSKGTYEKLNQNEIIRNYFSADFSPGSELDLFVSTLVMEKIDNSNLQLKEDKEIE